MRWREALHPVGMQRVALLAPSDALRDLLVQVADEGTVALDDVTSNSERHLTPAAERLQKLQRPAGAAVLSPRAPDLDRWEQDGRTDLIAGEAELEQRSAQSLTRGSVTALTGWMPADAVPRLTERVSGVGAAVVPMPRPAGVTPPTLLPQEGTAERTFAPLVETYATVPYADVNPSLMAGFAYVVMFGMMFADVGHGALLVLAALAVKLQRWPRLAKLRPVWLFLAGAGASSMVFGSLYGEFFGPTGVVPVVWLKPLDHPVLLLGSAVGVGAVLLGGAYALGTVNRLREGGWRSAAYAPSGLAGAAIFLGLGVVAGAVYFDLVWLAVLGGVVTATGVVVSFIGLLAAAGGGGAGAAEAGVELFDLVIRLGANIVSFARLAAFGLTHAALGDVIWQATKGAGGHGVAGLVGAVLIFVVGNALAFGLEGLIAAIQALRLEYYELFSRIFDTEGRPFRPWHVPLDTVDTVDTVNTVGTADTLEAPCSPG